MISSVKEKLISMIFRKKVPPRKHMHVSNIILLPELKAIYLPIPKVACSSVKKALATSLNIRMSSGIHRAEFLYINEFDLQKYPDYLRFSFVRNPWDRLVSCYSEKIRNDSQFSNDFFENGVHKGFLRYGLFKAGMSFQDFLIAVSGIPDEDADRHFRSQHSFLIDKDCNHYADKIGRFENLDHDFQNVMESLGRPDVKLPHLNKSRSKNNYRKYREYYDKDLLKIFEKRYYDDIKMFDYEF